MKDILKFLRMNKMQFKQILAVIAGLQIFLVLILGVIFPIDNNMIVGSILTTWATVIGYYFGSADKSEKEEKPKEESVE